MKIRVLSLGLLTIMCCSTRRDNQTVDKKAEEQKRDDKGLILYKNAFVHNFSSPVDMDSFKIYVSGQSIKDGQISFQIADKDGQVILDEEFSTTAFLDYGLKDNSTDKEKEEYIKCKIDKFFNADNFLQPAIDSKDTFDEDYTKREIWDDIISDQTAVGFYYLIEEEDGRRIAYSKRLRKVVLYYSCC